MIGPSPRVNFVVPSLEARRQLQGKTTSPTLFSDSSRRFLAILFSSYTTSVFDRDVFRAPGPLASSYRFRSLARTSKYRSIALTSCFSKVMERNIPNRLMFRLESQLSPSLYRFLPNCGTHHCLVKLYTRLSPTSFVAFIDL